MNGTGGCFVERAGRLERVPLALDDAGILRIVERIIAPLGLRLDRASPMVDARLPDGSRLHAVIPPLAIDGACVTIRRFGARPIALDEFGAGRARRGVPALGGRRGVERARLRRHQLGQDHAAQRAVRRRSTRPSGSSRSRRPPSSGSRSRTSSGSRRGPPNAEGAGAVSVRDLVRTALRMRPDRIVVGEVRGAEALDLLQALNTGHDGSLSTVHANGPVDALRRLATLALFSGVALPFDGDRRAGRGRGRRRRAGRARVATAPARIVDDRGGAATERGAIGTRPLFVAAEPAGCVPVGAPDAGAAAPGRARRRTRAGSRDRGRAGRARACSRASRLVDRGPPGPVAGPGAAAAPAAGAAAPGRRCGTGSPARSPGPTSISRRTTRCGSGCSPCSSAPGSARVLSPVAAVPVGARGARRRSGRAVVGPGPRRRARRAGAAGRAGPGRRPGCAPARPSARACASSPAAPGRSRPTSAGSTPATQLGVGLGDALAQWARERPLAGRAGGDAARSRWRSSVGGACAVALEGLGESLRAREATVREAHALSAQARISAFVVGGAPVAYLVFVSLADPGSLDLLLTTERGPGRASSSGSSLEGAGRAAGCACCCGASRDRAGARARVGRARRGSPLARRGAPCRRARRTERVALRPRRPRSRVAIVAAPAGRRAGPRGVGRSSRPARAGATPDDARSRAAAGPRPAPGRGRAPGARPTGRSSSPPAGVRRRPAPRSRARSDATRVGSSLARRARARSRSMLRRSRPVTDVLLASDRLGAPAGPALTRLAHDVRADLRRRAEARARTLPVKLLFPLVFLVLPAFGLLTVVPALLAALART